MVLNLKNKMMIKTYINKVVCLIAMLVIFNACDLKRLEPAQETAEGGGTVETFTAYAIASVDPTTNISGRVVFWKTDLDQTLVQISLQSPEFMSIWEVASDATPIDEEVMVTYPSSILSGPIGIEDSVFEDLFDVLIIPQEYGTDSTQTDVDDYDRDMDTDEDLPLLNFFAEFGESKFYVIDDSVFGEDEDGAAFVFYDNLSNIDAHVNIYDEDGTTIIAAGGIGVNADPVDSN